jgi:arginyl-tRNA synthetase
MTTLATALTELVRQAAHAAGHGDAPVPLDPCVATNDARHGDYQSNFAFRLGKRLRTNPREVAAAIVAALPASPLVASAGVAGPGFINLTLADDALAADVLERTRTPTLGGDRPGAGKTVVIDYSSPNIAKRMHVGHLRSTIIGNALHRLHAFCGWKVVADNHIGDWGTQFGMLIVAWGRWRDDAAYADDSVAELQRLYQLFRSNAETDASLIEAAREETAKLQAGDAENRALWNRFVAASLTEFDGVYDRLGIRFDVTCGESFYRDLVGPLVEGLLERGVAIHDQGAVIVPFEGSDGKGLGKNPLLIRKSDGAALYGTTDLAAIAYRMGEWQPDAMIYVTDHRQKLHFRQVFAAGRKMGHTDVEYVHVGFGMLRLEGDVVSTRAGTSLNLVDVLDTARDHAKVTVDLKSPDLPEAERWDIAEAVGVGAILYTDLSQNPQSDITFEWEKMLAATGNTAVYLMYAHARCHSIFRKASLSLDDHEPGHLVLAHPSERSLAVAISRTPEVAALAVSSARPNVFAEHVFRVATAWSAFYRDCKVVGTPEQGSRLALVQATARTLAVCLDLLGLQAPKRM